MVQRIVVDPAQIQPPIITLTAAQRHYLSRVLRLKVGDRIIALNGYGQSWRVVLQDSPTPGLLQAEILEPIESQTELPRSVTLAIALPKGNGFDEVVRQVTELGVTTIAPVISDRTLLSPSPQKLERWRRIAQEAAEQSERQIVPTLIDPVPFVEHLATLSPNAVHYIGITRHTASPLLNLLLATPQPLSPLTLAIGPEGGWTELELEQAIAAGYQPISLGDRILRTVTAPIVALALIAATAERGTVGK